MHAVSHLRPCCNDFIKKSACRMHSIFVLKRCNPHKHFPCLFITFMRAHFVYIFAKAGLPMRILQSNGSLVVQCTNQVDSFSQASRLAFTFSSDSEQSVFSKFSCQSSSKYHNIVRDSLQRIYVGSRHKDKTLPPPPKNK